MPTTTQSTHQTHDQTPPAFIDLTRSTPSTPSTPTLLFHTTTTPILISPSKTALVVIDMQNFFLSPALGRPDPSPGLTATTLLLSTALPAAHAAGVRVVWLNWGLTEGDMNSLPFALRRAFGEGRDGARGKDRGLYVGVGNSLGSVVVDGKEVEAGRMLFADQWNTALYAPLEAARCAHKGAVEDVVLGKNRMSGLWGGSSPATEYFDKEGITTLLFAGVNTDQCVLGSLMDGFVKGYDCVLVRDACGTGSPEFASKSVEWNVERTFGFVCTCADLEKGVEAMVW